MKTPRDYFFEVIKKKGDIEIRSSITAQINEEDFILVMEEYANLKVNAVLPQANVSGSLLIAVASIRSNYEMWRNGEIKDGAFSWHLQNNLSQIEKGLAGNDH